MNLNPVGYSVNVAKGYFKFNSAHFICADDLIENLHGHNYKVSIKIKSYIIKFLH